MASLICICMLHAPALFVIGAVLTVVTTFKLAMDSFSLGLTIPSSCLQTCVLTACLLSTSFFHVVHYSSGLWYGPLDAR